MLQTATLDNGIRIIFEEKSSEVVQCGLVVCAGTRHEEENDSGMAHFLEHVSFKGTEKRSSTQVSAFLEKYGGDLNAYTTKQETVFCATVLREDFRKAVDLLCDIVFHSIYPQVEIDKEVEVICDEIESYQDSPSELIFDEFESLVFENQDLGRDILGQASRLREYKTSDARRFADKNYQPSNCVFFVCGQLDFNEICHVVQHYSR